MARPTIRHVAQACGVAVSTASNALKDSALVRTETKARVKEAAQRLGYRVSSVAQTMRTGQSRTIGLVVADISHPFSAETAQVAADALSANGYHLIVTNTEYHAARQRAQLEFLIDRQIDGIALLLDHPDSPDVARVRSAGVPLVLLARPHRTEPCDFVGFDDRASVLMSLRHLVRLGHRRIAYLVWTTDSVLRDNRLVAFRECLGKLGLLDESLIVPCDRTMEGGRLAACALLDNSNPPTAFMAFSDLEAVGVIGAVRDRGLSVPGDISVVGTGDTYLASLPGIDLTAPDQQRGRIGKEAVRILLSRIKQANVPATTLRLGATLAVRGTTRAPP